MYVLTKKASMTTNGHAFFYTNSMRYRIRVKHMNERVHSPLCTDMARIAYAHSKTEIPQHISERHIKKGYVSCLFFYTKHFIQKGAVAIMQQPTYAQTTIVVHAPYHIQDCIQPLLKKRASIRYHLERSGIHPNHSDAYIDTCIHVYQHMLHHYRHTGHAFIQTPYDHMARLAHVLSFEYPYIAFDVHVTYTTQHEAIYMRYLNGVCIHYQTNHQALYERPF